MRALLLLTVSLTTTALRAQVAPSPEGPPAWPAPLRPSEAALPNPMNQVDIFFVARSASGGRHNSLIQKLTEPDCSLTVDGKAQPLRELSSAAKSPLTLGLLLDTSLDQQPVLPMEQQAAARFLRSALQTGDEALVLSFDVTVDLLADLTGSQKSLTHALGQAQINSASGHYANGTIPSIGRPKGALLYDAVYLAADNELRHQAGRKVLVVMTEGRDDGSKTKLREAIRAAQKANAIVYVLFVSDPGIYGILDESGGGAMRKLAQSTGGAFFHIGKDGRKLQAAFVEIQKELQSQYRISFVPTADTSTAGYRELKIACSQHGKPLQVQAQPGYYTLTH